MNTPNHNELAASIHQDNVKAGWWTNIETGAPLDRNFGEMVALQHSELSEAYWGLCYGLKDDHLPQFPMFHVEIADACIRVYDTIGGCFKDLDATGFVGQPIDFPEGFLGTDMTLLYLHLTLSHALEHYRKGRRLQSKFFLFKFLDACFEFAGIVGFDLLDVIEKKREYNRNRADHKIENRLKEDGKKI